MGGEKMYEKMRSAIKNLYEKIKRNPQRVMEKKDKKIVCEIQLMDEEGNPKGEPIKVYLQEISGETLLSRYYERKHTAYIPITINVQDDKVVVQERNPHF